LKATGPYGQMEVFIFMIKDGTVLTCSHPIPWDSRLAFGAMVGFTLASIDATRDPNLRLFFSQGGHSQWPPANQLLQG
jgi:hypothetical protein